jgi:hypothetical protein
VSPPSKEMLESARFRFPGGLVPQTEKELVHFELVRVNVLMRHIIDVLEKGCFPLKDTDATWHDAKAVLAAIGHAQEFTR